MKIPNKVS